MPKLARRFADDADAPPERRVWLIPHVAPGADRAARALNLGAIPPDRTRNPGAVPPDHRADLRLAWDKDGLRLRVDVADSKFVVPADGPAFGYDGIEIVFGGYERLFNYWQAFVDVGPDARSPQLRSRLIDRRVQQFHDPRRQRDILERLAPLGIGGRGGRSDAGWWAEAVLPLETLGVEATPAALVRLQVTVWNRDAEDGRSGGCVWGPPGWAASDPRATFVLRLAEGAVDPKRPHENRSTIERAAGAAGAGTYASSGQVQLWIPPNTKKLRGLYLALPGIGMRTGPDDSDWLGRPEVPPAAPQREFCAAEGFALAGVGESWTVDRPMFEQAVAAMAEETGRRDLVGLPMIVDGFSAGGKWTYHRWLREIPERLIAFGEMGYAGPMDKDGKHFPIALPEGGYAVAGFVHVGAKDKVGGWLTKESDEMAGQPLAMAELRIGRERGGPWALVVAPDLGHQVGGAMLYALPFYHDMVARRLGPDGKLRPVKLEDGWLGDPATHEIARWADYTRNRQEACWFPSRYCAGVWILLCTTAPGALKIEHLRSLVMDANDGRGL